jgi:ketol-acid reductoisomerase
MKGGRGPLLRARLQHPLRLHQAGGRARRVLVGPQGPGHTVRRESTRPDGRPRDRRRRTGRLRPGLGPSHCPTPWPLGGLRPGGIRTHLHRGDPKSDLFGEQASSAAGSSSRSIQYGFEVLTEGGLPARRWLLRGAPRTQADRRPHQRGRTSPKQRWSVSDTAEYGDYVSGPRVITPRRHGEHAGRCSRKSSRGAFAERFIIRSDAGAPEFADMRARGESHPIEQVGPRTQAPLRMGQARRRGLHRGVRAR